MSSALVDLTAVSYRYAGDDRDVLANLELQIEEREMVSIMGRSGSGKSTLLRLLGLLTRLQAGRYRLGGRDVSDLNERELTLLRRNEFGFIFQDANLIPHLTCGANVEYGLLLTGTERREREKRVRSVMESLGLDHLVHRAATEISGGERQRVAIARAAAGAPSLVLADEPTGSVDEESAGLVMDAIRTANEQGAAIIVVTHDPTVAAQSSRVLRVMHGHLEEAADPSGRGGQPKTAFGAPACEAQR